MPEENRLQKVTVITRSFQERANLKTFNKKQFQEKVAKPITTLLNFPIVEKIVVITNGEKGNRLAERLVDAQNTPTTKSLRESFPNEIKTKRLIPHICKNWGQNRGSATALNEGINFANKNHAEWILIWSPEMKMNGKLIHKALDSAIKEQLMVVGFLRKGWWKKTQWMVAQNTAALWNIQYLSDIGGFSRECNGTGEKISINGENVPIAGMEDFHAMLRMLKKDRRFRWGMIGKENPLAWNVNFKNNNQRERDHEIKVKRQYVVMQKYAKKIFPGKDFNKLMDELFARFHIK